MNRLVLFDIDGTILSMRHGVSKKLFAEAIQNVMNVEVELDKMPSFSGNTDLGIIRSISEITNIPYENYIERIEDIWDEKFSIFKKYSTKEYYHLHPKADEAISETSKLEDTKLGLLTGNFERNAFLKLSIFDLRNYFHFGAFGDDNEFRNNLPAIAIARAKSYTELDFPLDRVILIGDSPRDVECANFARIKVLAVSTGGFSQEYMKSIGADYTFEDLSDTKKVIEVINSI